MTAADAINAAARDIARAGRAAYRQFGEAGVWICDVYAVFAGQVSREVFDATLIAERREGTVRLSRCDMVEGHGEKVRASELRYFSSEAHLVKVRV